MTESHAKGHAKGQRQSNVPGSKLTISMAALVALAAGCSNDMDQLKQKISEVKGRPGDRIEPLPEIKPYEAFVYNPNGMRSPFVPSVPVQAENAGGLRPDSKRAREFLEQFPLDTLRMVGTLKLQGQFFGLVQGKDGLVHRVLPGSFIGQNEGRIANISDSKISLIEIVPDGLGGYIERPAALALSE